MYFVFTRNLECFMQFLPVYQYFFHFLKCLVTMSQSIKMTKLFFVFVLCGLNDSFNIIYTYINAELYNVPSNSFMLV